jgi:hypothetical protein
MKKKRYAERIAYVIQNHYRHRLNTEAGKISGCSDDEIKALMKAQGVERLPQTYVEIMQQVGKVHLIVASWDDAVKLKQHLIRSLEETPYTLPQDAFVFKEHQGYLWWFFLTDNEDEDPPVYIYVEEQDFVIAKDKLSAFVLTEVN